MSKIIIDVDGLYKRYRLGSIGYGTLREDLQSWWAKVLKKEDPNSMVNLEEKDTYNESSFLAINNLSFKVNEGEKVGIIGKNGAGKSTLLKMLSRITIPTKGTIKLRGKLASLLEVGTGFHAELTGRENIYMNGAIMGMKKHEIDKKIDEIIAFSEIEKFIDTPVKRYSSGMYVRLGFAVAAHLDPDILIVDEVLAVGDMEFQKKCIDKMDDVARAGRTILFVSHNISMIRALCDRTLLLEKGNVLFDGNAGEGISLYVDKCNKVENSSDIANRERRSGLSQRLRLVSIQVYSESKKNPTSLSSKVPFKVAFKVENKSNSIVKGAMDVYIANNYEQLVYMNSVLLQKKEYGFPPGISTIECNVAATNLYAGRYYINCGITVPGKEDIDFVNRAYTFDVDEFDPYNVGYNLKSEYSVGKFNVNHSWSELF